MSDVRACVRQRTKRERERTFSANTYARNSGVIRYARVAAQGREKEERERERGRERERDRERERLRL